MRVVMLSLSKHGGQAIARPSTGSG